jgi:hypothetical protein
MPADAGGLRQSILLQQLIPGDGCFRWISAPLLSVSALSPAGSRSGTCTRSSHPLPTRRMINVGDGDSGIIEK